MDDINRHIVVIWQVVGVLAASVAAIAISEQHGVPLEVAVALSFLVSGWALEHLHDSNYWYNRNLVMITNIERVFLNNEDLQLVHPYFSKYRNSNSFLSHMQAHRRFILIFCALIFSYYYIGLSVSAIDHSRNLFLKICPFIGGLILFCWDRHLIWKYTKKYGDYLKISLGIEIENKIDFGKSHGS